MYRRSRAVCAACGSVGARAATTVRTRRRGVPRPADDAVSPGIQYMREHSILYLHVGLGRKCPT